MSGTRAYPNWQDAYAAGGVEQMPWYFSELDPDLAAALDACAVRPGARVLDQGTGPGTQAIALAKRGYVVTASDIAPAAISYAQNKAEADGVKIDFIVDDVLAPKVDGPFAAIFDRGCFHVLAPETYAAYAGSMQRLLAPSGFLFLKTFSHLQPGDQGPHRFARDQIETAFGDCFEIVSIVDTVYQGQLSPLPKALFSTMRRR